MFPYEKQSIEPKLPRGFFGFLEDYFLNILGRHAKLLDKRAQEAAMKEELLSIGKMAKLNRVSVATLRLYDELGLLKPRYVDPCSGYRYYDIYQNARLDMIAYMKELGMSLSEIADVFEKEDITLIEDILSQKNEQIHEQIRQLKARHDAVERAIMSIERYRKSPTTGTMALEYIDRRYIWGIPCSTNFYSSDIRSYEQILLELQLALEEHDFQQIHSYHIGTSIMQEDFLQGRFVANQIFIFTTRYKQSEQRALQVIDSGMYACIYLDNYDEEITYAQKLKNYCEANNYLISGNYICEVMTEFNVFDSDHRSMFLKLQVPVAFSK